MGRWGVGQFFGHLDMSESLSFDRLWTWKNISALDITGLEGTVFLSALGKPMKAPNHPSNWMTGNSSSVFCWRQHSSLSLLTHYMGGLCELLVWQLIQVQVIQFWIMWEALGICLSDLQHGMWFSCGHSNPLAPLLVGEKGWGGWHDPSDYIGEMYENTDKHSVSSVEECSCRVY